VELASPEMVAELLAHIARARPVRRGSGLFDGEQPRERPAGRPRAHCRCGRCPQCLENERWERIFTQKFADPDYYTRRHVRTSSPLDSL
jgi:hypothetical protein